MLKVRLVAVLILRNGCVVQSVRFRHTNIIHSRAATAVEFFGRWAIDEIVLLDVSRDRTERDKFHAVLKEISRRCFVPLSAGGWVDSAEEAMTLLHEGADKVIVNTAVSTQPGLLGELSSFMGSQSVVLSVDAKSTGKGTYEVYVDRGRTSTGQAPERWVSKAVADGAGEVFLNCIDNDGARLGYDLELLRRVVRVAAVPVIAMGGVSTWQHLVDGVKIGGADAVAAANIFHYTEQSTKKAKAYMLSKGVAVRRPLEAKK